MYANNLQISAAELKRYDELCLIALDCARNNDVNTLKSMLEAGFCVDFCDNKGNSLLMLATYNGSYDCAKMLILNGANVNLKNDRGQTPLAGVCFKGDLSMVRLLVENGANVHEDNGMGLKAYHFALMFAKFKIAKYLKSKM